MIAVLVFACLAAACAVGARKSTDPIGRGVLGGATVLFAVLVFVGLLS